MGEAGWKGGRRGVWESVTAPCGSSDGGGGGSPAPDRFVTRTRKIVDSERKPIEETRARVREERQAAAEEAAKRKEAEEAAAAEAAKAEEEAIRNKE